MIVTNVLRWAESQAIQSRVASVEDAARELGHPAAEIDAAFRALIASGAMTCRSVGRDRRFAPDLPEGNIYLGIRVRQG